MDLNRLLALFSAFNRAGVDYIVLGDLAQLFHGYFALTERLEIGLASERHEPGAREALLEVFPGTILESRNGLYFRALVPQTPFFIDIVSARTDDAEILTLPGGVPVRVGRLRGQPHGSPATDDYAREGYTIRERLSALQTFARAVVPNVAQPRGVRKYRSLEAADADRERWDDLRSARIRAERLRQ